MSDAAQSLPLEGELQATREHVLQLEETCRQLQIQLLESRARLNGGPAGEPYEESWRSLVQHAPDLITTVDRQGQILFINRGLPGYERDQMIGQSIYDYVLPEHHERVRRVFAQVLASGEAMGYEASTVSPSGEIFWYHSQVGPIRRQGDISSLILISNDITDRRRSEDAFAALLQREQVIYKTIEQSERRYRFLADSSVVLASSLDVETTFASLARLAVPQIADWFAVDLIEADGTPRCLTALHADPCKEALAQQLCEHYPIDPLASRGVARVIRTGCAELFEEVPEALLLELAYSDEHLELLEQLGIRSALIVPLAARGRLLGALTLAIAGSERRYGPGDLQLAEDLARRAALALDNARLYAAEQRERNRAETANRMKDEFLATVSHELRTPLNSILGFTQLLRRGQLDQTRVALALDAIERNARAQARLTEDLLDVSRISTGKLRLTVQPLNVQGVVEAAIETMRTAAEAKAIALVTDFPPLPCTVVADPNRLQQVVWNLLSNAIKFTPQEGRIRVSIERGENQARIVVADSGAGIPAEFLPYVFDRFRQADSTSTRIFGGLGLGLAIVRHLVELHGGTVGAESPGPNLGATFTVTLPLMSADQLSPAAGAPA